MSEIQQTPLLEVEKPRAFARRVLLALATLLAFGALVVGLIAIAYFGAPSSKRKPPITRTVAAAAFHAPPGASADRSAPRRA